MSIERIPYKREVSLSPDLLCGKRENVYATAVRHYYQQACEVAVWRNIFLEKMKGRYFITRNINCDLVN